MVSVVSIVDGDQHVVHRGSVRNRLRLNSSMSALCRVLVPYSTGRSEGSVLGDARTLQFWVLSCIPRGSVSSFSVHMQSSEPTDTVRFACMRLLTDHPIAFAYCVVSVLDKHPTFLSLI